MLKSIFLGAGDARVPNLSRTHKHKHPISKQTHTSRGIIVTDFPAYRRGSGAGAHGAYNPEAKEGLEMRHGISL